MTTHSNDNRTTRQFDNLALIAGLTKIAATHPSFALGGATVNTADIVASLQADNAAMNAIASTKAAWQAAVQAGQTQQVETQTLAAKVKQALQVVFGGQVDALADFGLKPPKPRTPLTAEQQAAASAKARATRAARKTMGSQQKKAVKGNVVGVTVTPMVVTPPIAPKP